MKQPSANTHAVATENHIESYAAKHIRLFLFSSALNHTYTTNCRPQQKKAGPIGPAFEFRHASQPVSGGTS